MRCNWLLTLFVLLGVMQAQAHESRPLFVEITQQESGLYLLQYKIPSSIPNHNAPQVIMPKELEPLGAMATYMLGQGMLKSQQYKSDVPINGLPIHVQYPVINPSVSSIIKVRMLDGSQFQTVLGPDQLHWQIPEEESFWGVQGNVGAGGVA